MKTKKKQTQKTKQKTKNQKIFIVCKEFRLPSWAVIKKTMNQQIVLDGRNIYDKKEMEELGFVYSCIGK